MLSQLLVGELNTPKQIDARIMVAQRGSILAKVVEDGFRLCELGIHPCESGFHLCDIDSFNIFLLRKP
jgi:hypothetical protein